MACHPNADDVTPTEQRAAEGEAAVSQAKVITIDASALSREQIEEVARHIEGLGDVAQAKVKVRQDREGNSEVLIEIAGADLPSDDYLLEEIKGMSGMADASIAVQAVHPDDVAPDAALSDKDKTPEQIKAEVIERLRAEGVEGEVFVDVVDEDGERRVEVRVEAKGDGPAPKVLSE